MTMLIDGRNGFFIKSCSTNKFGIMRYFGVKRKSYAGSVIERLYDYYCLGAKSVFGEYLKYYRREFSSYDDFLTRKYNLFSEDMLKVNKYLLFYKNPRFTEDGGITHLLDDETFYGIIIKFLGGEVNED